MHKHTKTDTLHSAENQVVFGVVLHSTKVGWSFGFGKDFMPRLTQSALAALIDHTLLKPEATRTEIEKLCAEAGEYHFASVCVQPYRAALAAELLKNSSV